MRIPDVLDSDGKRKRLLDLSFSLYECLGDLMQDVSLLDDDQYVLTDEQLDRIRTSAMNCLGDIKLLIPMLRPLNPYG